MRKIGHLHHVRLFLLTFHLPVRNVRLESLPEVDCAHESIDDCDDNQDNGDDSKCCQRFTDRTIAIRSVSTLVHSDEFKKKVGASPKVESLSSILSVQVVSNIMVGSVLTIMATIPTVLSFRVI